MCRGLARRILVVSSVLLLLGCDRVPGACAQTPSGSAATDGHRGGEIALSFDDAPVASGFRFTGVERTNRIVEALEREQVKEAIFFCVTENFDIRDGRRRIERYAHAGHLIANHTHSHLILDETNPEVFIEDIRRADAILRIMPGFVPLFRYPGSREGATPEAQRQVRDALARMGYGLGYFTVDSADWYVQTRYEAMFRNHKQVDEEKLRAAYLESVSRAIDFYDQLARAVLGRSPKHVLILHESDLNALFVGDLVRYIRSKGWSIIPASEAYADPLAQQIPESRPTQYRLSGLAAERGYGGPLYNPWASPGKLNELLAGAFP